MEKHGLRPVRLVLSDLSAWQKLVARLGPERVSFFDKPVSFSEIPKQYRALTIFSAFHHLPPKAAKALLSEAVANRDGICIVEFTRRTWLDRLSMLPALLLNLIAPWVSGRWRAGKLLFKPSHRCHGELWGQSAPCPAILPRKSKRCFRLEARRAFPTEQRQCQIFLQILGNRLCQADVPEKIICKSISYVIWHRICL